MTTKIITRPVAPAFPDPDTVQRLLTRRIAIRLGLSMPVAAVVAALAGLGPDSGRRA